MTKSTLIPEPNLYFGNDGENIDPKVGLISFGCYGRFSRGQSEPLIIRAGFIGTKKSKQLLEVWLERLKHRIAGRVYSDNKREVDFPGLALDSPLGFEVKLDDSCCQEIDESAIENLKTKSRKERIVELVKIYDQKFKDLEGTTDPHPSLVFLPLSEQAVQLCKDPLQVGNKIVYERKNATEFGTDYPPLFDFHNAIKVIAYKHGAMVTQIIQPETMSFKSVGTSSEDPATIAWNISVATYYKATGIPWKLSELEDTTCYIGLSFYKELNGSDFNMRASMAHVYLKTGESQVIRGKPFRWDDNMGKTPSLTASLAKEIIDDVLSLYKRQRAGSLPKRVVIHKTSPFTADEIGGFNESLKGVELADYIHINEKNTVRLFPKSEEYPAIRGTLVYDKMKLLLYTTGYVPLLDTYKGASIPAPLILDAYRLDSQPEQVAKDVLALTKLDWNNAYFNTRLPVTISVSRKVSSVLSESSAQDLKEPPTNYKFYM